ncbi:nuclear transport factor 2 family protein [Pseudonocardia sp. ICBG1293]|uniref:nuclear transport factor 2 family protein n=1 Tax=Pseudonocardia sp. ICBG1293 TaxID=2844382 RepID=UPI001CCD0378|nr:nuclear transport factor 2 family protein [Pseudonocardia sp. ICBG1293]
MSTAEWEALPETVKTFMTALDSREPDRALATFTSDAVVTDDGRDHAGTDEIGAWLASAVTEYTYTAEFTGASATEAGVDVGQHLEGDFPGGVVDLNYRFTLDGAAIGRLVIEP